MTNEIFDVLYTADYIKDGEVNQDAVSRMSKRQIIDFAHFSKEATSVKDYERQPGIVKQCASSSLSGARIPCGDLTCRTRRVTELGYFSALYSDKVHIKNIFTDYISHGFMQTSEEAFVQQRFYEDLIIFNKIQPFIESGIVVPITPEKNYCIHCLAKNNFGADADKRLRIEWENLCENYLKNADFWIGKRKEEYRVYIEASPELIEHGTTGFPMPELPELLSGNPRILKTLESGKEIKLTKNRAKQLNLHRIIADIVFKHMVFDISMNQILGTSILTERSIHIHILNALSRDSSLEKRNRIIEKHLTSLVPFATELEPHELLSLRKGEEEAFISYRHALNKAVEECIKQKSDFSERDAETIYEDIISPQLAAMDKKVKSARRTFLKGTTRKVAGLSAAIGIGTYFGFLPQDILAVASALGVGKVSVEVIENAMNQTDTKEIVRNEDMYFLWKVRQQSKN